MRAAAVAAVVIGGLGAFGCAAETSTAPVGKRAEAICCGPLCCLIDDECWGAGQTNPRNPCQTCEPFESGGRAWTTAPDCTFDGGPDGGPRPDGGRAPDPLDAGAPARDAAPPPAATADDGCATAPRPAGAAWLAAPLLALVFATRRRRA